MRIFVTGATGCLGYHFVNVAVSRGCKVLCLRRPTSKSLFEPIIEQAIEWVSNDDPRLPEVVKKFQPDILFHAAWGGVRGEDRDNIDIQYENIIMSRKLFKLYSYKQIISIGSQAEYGLYKDLVRENHLLRPAIEYAKAKIQCCNEMKEYCETHNIEWQWIRIFTVFGEKQTGGLIKMAIEKCLGDEKFLPTTLGEQRYSYLYSFDFARAVCNMLGCKGKSGIYNLSQPRCLLSNRYVLEKIKDLTGSNIELQFGAIPYPENQVMLMDGCVTKFEQAFGSIPFTDFDIALQNTISSFKNK